jgi:GNAT superfamily N-acetyltransferase
MMEFQICEESIANVLEHAEVSILFKYDCIFDLTLVNSGLAGFVLTENHLAVAQIKDYDAIEGEGPACWPARFDLSNWGFIVARGSGQRVGGAVVAFDTAGVDMLEGRSDLAVLWDIRVAQAFRGQGVGAALFQAAERWAIEHGCRQLKVETQNTNVAACRFYSGQGCTLGAINRFAYPALPDEIQMLWHKDLV